MAETTRSSENMLVKLANLDQLLRVAGQVIIASSNLGLTYKNVQALYDEGKSVNLETVEATKDLAAITSIISSDLHNLVQAIRTVDLKDLGFRTRRLVRDVARKTGKRVRFEIEGEGTTVDKTIVEKLYDPISHQLRNAVDHGIEDPLTRARKGKPEEGRITFRAYNSENETFIEIEDDGAGVDMESLRQRGIEMGTIQPDDEFTEDDALEIMWSPGISTAKKVSEVSGRGVGMDVVREQITGLGGSVSFKTQKDKGTSFTFRVPLVSAVNIVDALVVRSGSYLFAFPITNVITTMSISPEEVNSTLGKGEMVKYLNGLLPLHSLNKVLDGTDVKDQNGNISILVIDHKGSQIALKISEFLSPQKLVIIPFDGALKVDGLSGTTILGGKQLGFIIDTPSLINRAKGKKQGLRQKKMDEVVQEIKEEKTKEEKVAVTVAEQAEKEESPSITEEDPDVAQEFIVEIEKLLPALNEVLFALESDLKNNEIINKAFRLFHTLKGNFIMMGLAKGGETIHSVESVLDRARGRKLELNPEAMDILMEGASYIEEAVRLSKAGQWKDEASDTILESSAKILPEQRSEKRISTDVASDEIKLSHEASYRANHYRLKRTPFYRCYIEFDAGKQPPFLVACLIYKRICELGDVLGTVPPLDDVEKGLMENKFKLLLASDTDADVLEKSLVSLLTKHYGATSVKFGRFD